MSQFKSMPFGVLGKILAATAALVDYEHHLGKVFYGEDGKVYQLVKFETGGTTLASPQYKTFKWHDRTTFEVEPVDANADRVLGVCPCTEAELAADDLFFVQIDGPATLMQGNDTGNYCTAGEYVRPDDDTDLGKCAGNGTTYDEGVTFAIARATVAAADTTLLVDLLGPLKG